MRVQCVQNTKKESREFNNSLKTDLYSTITGVMYSMFFNVGYGLGTKIRVIGMRIRVCICFILLIH
jgi:hypothetical protein